MSYGLVKLPPPYCWPVGAKVRAGNFRGEVIEQVGPWSVRVKTPIGKIVGTTTTDLEKDK